MINKLEKHHILLNELMIVIFILLSLASSFLIISHHTLYYGSDMEFHWQEIFELLRSNRLFPSFALNSFLKSGSAVLTMYPYLFLYPFVWIYQSLHSIQDTMYIIFIINTFISLLIDYYGSLIVTNKNKTMSFTFALMYSLSSSFIVNTFTTSDFGVLYTIMFLPLVIFGFIQWLRKGKWLMLSLGISLIVYCNVLAAAFIPVLLIIWLIISFQYLNKIKIINLLKAALLAILTTIAFWLPAIKILMWNKLSVPRRSHVQNFTMMLKNAINLALGVKFNVDDHYILTIYSLIGIVLGLIFYTKLGPILRKSYIFSLIVMWICSNHFPWLEINARFPLIESLQFTGRMLILPQVILTFIFAFCISNLLQKLSSVKLPLLIVIGLLIISTQLYTEKALINQPHIDATQKVINSTKNEPELFNYYPKAL